MRHDTLVGGGALIVLRNVGQLLLYIAAIPLLLLPVSVYYGELNAIGPVLAMVATFAVAGALLSRLPVKREPRLREGMLIAAVGWMAVPAASVVLFVGLEGWSALDGFFESMSAWTGTGMTFADVTTLHKTTLFWRSLMQWVGGLGVIVLTLAILARPGTGAHTLYVSEAREDKLRPSVLSTVRLLWRIYILLSLAGFLLLLAVGLPAWDALNHAMTAIATGGMSTHPDSVGGFETYQQMAFIPIMVVGSLPFVATYALFRGRWRDFVKDEQIRAILGVGLLIIGFLAWGLSSTDLLSSSAERWAAAAFIGASALTTAGFQNVDVTPWFPELKVALIGVMLLGAAAGSTAGGLKIFRGILLFKGAFWKLKRAGLPHFAVTSFELGGERLDQREANEEFAEAAFILVLLMALLLGSFVVLLVLLPARFEVIDVLFDIASAVGNNGITSGIIGPAFPEAAKATLVVIMWAGRLEILPVLLLLRGLIPTRR